jgi:hypothetical protein
MSGMKAGEGLERRWSEIRASMSVRRSAVSKLKRTVSLADLLDPNPKHRDRCIQEQSCWLWVVFLRLAGRRLGCGRELR